MKISSEEEILEKFRVGGHFDTNVEAMIGWADLPLFPIKEALKLWQGENTLTLCNNDVSSASVSVEKAFELVLGFAFPCELSSSQITFKIPFGRWELRGVKYNITYNFTLFLAARLWAIRHAPGELPPSPELKKFLDYLKSVPDMEDPDYWEMFDLAKHAKVRDEIDAELNGKPIRLDGRQIAEEILPGVVKCELQEDQSMKIWYPDTPDQIYIIHDTPFVAIFESLNEWCANHNQRDPI